MNDDQIKGKTREITGAVKEGVGDASGDESLRGEGKAEKNTGKAQGAFGKVKETVKDIAHDVKNDTSTKR